MPETGFDTGAALGRAMEQMQGMSFLQHLEELRMRIIKALLFVAAGFGVCWWFHEEIYGLMQKPIIAALAHYNLATKLNYTNPTEPFNMYLKVSLIAGVFVASPFVLYQVWAFIAPGLYRHEKRYVLPFMASTVFLFAAGGYFGYRVVYPAALDFLVGWSQQFNPIITITEYTDLFMVIIVGLGVIFEMPILVFFLALMGLVTAGFMWKHLRYAILIIFVIAAIVTPTTDIMNMCLFAAPMVLLYVVSIAVAWLVHPKRRKARKAKLQS